MKVIFVCPRFIRNSVASRAPRASSKPTAFSLRIGGGIAHQVVPEQDIRNRKPVQVAREAGIVRARQHDSFHAAVLAQNARKIAVGQHGLQRCNRSGRRPPGGVAAGCNPPRPLRIRE